MRVAEALSLSTTLRDWGGATQQGGAAAWLVAHNAADLPAGLLAGLRNPDSTASGLAVDRDPKNLESPCRTHHGPTSRGSLADLENLPRLQFYRHSLI